MASVKKSVRTNQALQVIHHSNAGMSIIEACQEVGIPRSTFYYFITTHPDAIATFQEMQMMTALQQLALILENQTQILERVIEDGLSENTNPRQRLAIYKELSKKTEELLQKLPNSKVSGEELDALFSGPVLKPGESRLAS